MKLWIIVPGISCWLGFGLLYLAFTGGAAQLQAEGADLQSPEHNEAACSDEAHDGDLRKRAEELIETRVLKPWRAAVNAPRRKMSRALVMIPDAPHVYYRVESHAQMPRFSQGVLGHFLPPSRNIRKARQIPFLVDVVRDQIWVFDEKWSLSEEWLQNSVPAAYGQLIKMQRGEVIEENKPGKSEIPKGIPKINPLDSPDTEVEPSA